MFFVSDGVLLEQKYPKRGGFDSPTPLNDKGSALNPFKDISKVYNLLLCSFYQIQKLQVGAIRKPISRAPKIIVRQRKLITMILPSFLDFLVVLILWHILSV